MESSDERIEDKDRGGNAAGGRWLTSSIAFASAAPDALRAAARTLRRYITVARRSDTIPVEDPLPEENRGDAARMRNTPAGNASVLKTSNVSWDLEVARSAQRAFRTMLARDRQRASRALDDIGVEPFSGDIVALRVPDRPAADSP